MNAQEKRPVYTNETYKRDPYIRKEKFKRDIYIRETNAYKKEPGCKQIDLALCTLTEKYTVV